MTGIDVLRSHEPLWGEWTLGNSIGSGAQAQVYSVHNVSGESCALKVIPLSGSANEQSNVREQLRLTEQLATTGGVVPCLRTGEFSGYGLSVAVILMPKLTALSSIMLESDTQMPVSEVLKIGHDLCLALSECRKNGIIHRDIKPANVFRDINGNYFLGDLGIARFLDHTMLATRKGTPAYMSPEIASGKPCTYSSDIYSLGVMLYQLLNDNRLPLLDENARYNDIELAVARRLDGEALPLPANANNQLGQLVCDMCSFEAKKRPKADDCLSEFRKYIDTISRSGTLPPARKRIGKGRLATFIVTALFALVLCAAMPFILHPASPEQQTDASISAANAFCSGGTAGDEQWLYFGRASDLSGAYRLSLDTGESQSIYDGSMTQLNLCGDSIYFCAANTIESAELLEDGSTQVYMRTGIRRMDKSGENEQKLCDCSTYNAVEYGGWVYHCVTNLNLHDLDPERESDPDADPTFARIMRVKNDGSTEETLCELPGVYITGMYVYHDRIYYICSDYTSAEGAEEYVASAALDGTDIFRLIDHETDCIDFHSDNIYFSANGGSLMRTKLDGGEAAVQVGNIMAEDFCICSHGIICETGDCVSLYDFDGTLIRKLYDDSIIQMQFVGEDKLIAQISFFNIQLIDIESGTAEPFDNFRFELM